MKIGPYQLRDYQVAGVDNTRRALAEIMQQKKPARVLMVGSTGSGKSVSALALLALAREKNKRAWFITSGRNLIFQFARHMEKAGLTFSVLMNQSDPFEYYPSSPLQIISKDTLISRMENIPIIGPDLIIVDEADICTSAAWMKVIGMAEVEIGLTATPCDGDGKGLGNIYDKMVEVVRMSELIAAGHLVGCPEGKCYSYKRPDLSGAKMSGSNYSLDWLAERMNRPRLVGDIVESYRKLGEGKPFIAFTTRIAHSMSVAEQFNGAGIICEHIDGDTEQDERDAIFKKMLSGEVQGVSQCGTINRGVDIPCASVGLNATPSKRYRDYLQKVGRLTRPCPEIGKEYFIWIDHSGAVFEHGWPCDDPEWTLDTDFCIEDVREEKKREKKEREPYCCPECAAMWTVGTSCPNCGYKQKKRGQMMETESGELVPVPKKRAKPGKSTQSDEQKCWMMCLAVMANKGSSYASASRMFKHKTGMWPDDSGVGPLADMSQRNMPVATLWPNFVRKKRA